MSKLILVGLWVFAALVPAAESLAANCPDGIVGEGDRQFEVLRRCGEPDLRDVSDAVYLPGYGVISATEVWYYNRGASRLVRILRFRDGRLVGIETGGYGFNAPSSQPCEPAAIQIGMSRFRLLAECGEPASRSRRIELLATRPYGGNGPSLLQPRPVDEWVYLFGDNRFIRFVMLVDGQVVAIETGERGDP